MRLVRFSDSGRLRLGALIADGAFVVDLQASVTQYLLSEGDLLANEASRIRIPADTATFLANGPRSQSLAHQGLRHALAHRDHADPTLIRPRSQVHLELPLTPPLIICGGGNFWGHLRESGREKPDHVEFFLKSSTGLIGPQDDIPYRPSVSRKLDYEAELGIVIGKRGHRIPRERALEHVFGYTAVNDLALRDRQICRWEDAAFQVKYGNGKVFDGNLALGPAIVTADEIDDPMDLTIRCWVDGELRQDSNTREYIWGVAEVIEYYSSLITLEPGFLICPGTPGGCAVGSDPECGGRSTHIAAGSQYLRPGQTVVVEVGGVGRIENRVREVLGSVCAAAASTGGIS